MYIPKQILITESSKDSPKAQEIQKRILSYDENIPLYLKHDEVEHKQWEKLDAKDRWRYRKNSVIISQRGTPFITTFASPGKIVEDLGTILNVAYHCAYDCEYCYLQNVMPGQHILYSNVERLEDEIAIEPYVHRAILTLWTMLSFAQKQNLLKIPKNFSKAANYLRLRFQKENVRTDNEAIALLYTLIKDPQKSLYRKFLTKREKRILDDEEDVLTPKKLPEMKKSHFKITRKLLGEYYEKNKRYVPRLNTSEYCDFLGIDHLGGNAKLLMSILLKNKNIEYGFRTKSANVDELLKYDGDNRVRIAINFNTQYVIEKYEHGTASLKERLEAAKKVQKAKGFGLKIVIEPIIMYPGWIEDYRALVRTIVTTLDPKVVIDFTFATVRYGRKLMSRITRNFPGSDLINAKNELVLADGDTKWRYTEKQRYSVYKVMIEEVRTVVPKAIIRLGAETAVLWDQLRLKKDEHIGKSVYQFIGKK